MVVYDVQMERSGDFYRYYSPQFSDVSGFGRSENEAMADFLKKLYDELNRIITNGEYFPAPVEKETIQKRANSKEGNNSIAFTSDVALTMFLHRAMLEKRVTRQELARFLAFQDEIPETDWTVENLRQAEPKASPKYQKVKRLLDVNHRSSIHEMSEAFRVMDYSVDFVIRPKGLVEWEPELSLAMS